jgi:Sec-independent protein translocase protein TatA
MLWIILLIVVALVVAYKYRLAILSKVLGQSQSRVQRALERRKRS